MRKFLIFLLCVIISGSGQTVRALSVVTTPANEFLATAPLMITGYQTIDAAQNLAAVEVYNLSDNLVNLTDWQLFVVLKDGTSQPVDATTAYSGWLQPSSHVVYAASGATTYKLAASKQPTAITTIELHYVGTSGAYKPATASIKDTSELAFFRTYTSTGYSTAAQPFLATPTRAFYDDGLYVTPTLSDKLRIVEVYPYSSDCAPNDTSVLCGDYIKLQNVGSDEITLDDLVVRTDSSSASRTTANTFTLTGVLKADEYTAVTKTDSGAKISLTNSGGYVWLEDAWGMARYDNTVTRYDAAGSGEQGYAYALANDNAWAWTTTPQPVGGNVITIPVVVVAECSAGKYRNPDTGRCRTIEEAVNALSVCEEGYERNLATNRCRKISVVTTASLTPCLEGQERNPATNRCRSIASAVAELMPCEEGYERNPATNRCRKVSSTSVPEAAFPVTPVKVPAGDTAGWWAFGVVLALAMGYAAWEWRVEILAVSRRALGIFARTK